MYHFSYFKDKDRQALLDLLDRYPFAFLSGSFISGDPVATQVPLLWEERDGELYLRGHMMRKTDHHRAFLENPKVLAVFTGPQAYVSASWYSQPRIGSTWNYMSVHVSGSLRFMNEAELVALMRQFTLHFEKGNIASPTIYDNLPADFLEKMMPGIAGFELRAERLDHVFKLSQNRDAPSYDNIIRQLEAQGGTAAAVAAEMRKRRVTLFPPGVEWDPTRFDS